MAVFAGIAILLLIGAGLAVIFAPVFLAAWLFGAVFGPVGIIAVLGFLFCCFARE